MTKEVCRHYVMAANFFADNNVMVISGNTCYKYIPLKYNIRLAKLCELPWLPGGITTDLLPYAGLGCGLYCRPNRVFLELKTIEKSKFGVRFLTRMQVTNRQYTVYFVLF